MSRRTMAHAAAAAAAVLACASAHGGVPAAHAPARAGTAGFVDAPRADAYPGTLHLDVDATDLAHEVLRVRSTVPVAPGRRLTLLVPRFLPGTHGPYGQIETIAGLTVTGGGRTLAWRRDAVDVHAFHVDVPPDVREIDLRYDVLENDQESGGSFGAQMLILRWSRALIYPAGHDVRGIAVRPRVKWPAGWTSAGALDARATEDGGWTRYEVVDADTLVDSPLYGGRLHRAVPLAEGARPVTLQLFADEPEDLEVPKEAEQALRRLVAEADALFGARHWRRYELLLGLSDRIGGAGLEHHESSENVLKSGYLRKWKERTLDHYLMPHEFAHSWNGKFRRPDGHDVAHFNQPLRNELLWVYEGQTQFWGHVLEARAGMVSAERAREQLASNVARFLQQPGRAWRTLEDTTAEPLATGRRTRRMWASHTRGEDYYGEAALIWHEVDARLREASGGARSIDDFARAFFGVHDGRVARLHYGFEELAAALDAVQPLGWAAWLRDRVASREATPAWAGMLERTGWRLAWSDEPTSFDKDRAKERKIDLFRHSLGFDVGRDGVLTSMVWDGPAFQAGLRTGLKLIAVNGREYTAERLTQALRANVDGSRPIELLVKDRDRLRTTTIDVRTGPRFPRLERIPGSVERLDAGLYRARSG